jgi:heptosyltransferase-1
LLGVEELEAGPLEIFATESEKEQAQHLLIKNIGRVKPRVGLIPSAGSNWRIWPLDRYAELANILVRTNNVEIVLLGGKDDRATCHAVSERMNVKPLDLSGKTTLRELIAVVGELDLVIANVTGPMHVAIALPKPKVIGLYGVADTIQYAPWGMNAKMLTKRTTRDAYWNRVDYRKDYEVLCQITVDDVLESVKSTMLP